MYGNGRETGKDRMEKGGKQGGMDGREGKKME